MVNQFIKINFYSITIFVLFTTIFVLFTIFVPFVYYICPFSTPSFTIFVLFLAFKNVSITLTNKEKDPNHHFSPEKTILK